MNVYDKVYEYDEFFKSFLDGSAFQGRKIVNKFDVLDELVSYYRHKIDTADNNMGYLKLGHELFTKWIHFTHCKGGYNVIGDINRAQSTIN